MSHYTRLSLQPLLEETDAAREVSHPEVAEPHNVVFDMDVEEQYDIECRDQSPFRSFCSYSSDGEDRHMQELHDLNCEVSGSSVAVRFDVELPVSCNVSHM